MLLKNGTGSGKGGLGDYCFSIITSFIIWGFNLVHIFFCIKNKNSEDDITGKINKEILSGWLPSHRKISMGGQIIISVPDDQDSAQEGSHVNLTSVMRQRYIASIKVKPNPCVWGPGRPFSWRPLARVSSGWQSWHAPSEWHLLKRY